MMPNTLIYSHLLQSYRFLSVVREYFSRLMHLYSQALRDLVGSGEKPGGPSRVPVHQTRYWQVVKQVANKREQTHKARNRLTDHVVPTAIGLGIGASAVAPGRLVDKSRED